MNDGQPEGYSNPSANLPVRPMPYHLNRVRSGLRDRCGIS